MKKKSSIKWKVFLYLIGFTLFLLGLLWYFQVVHLNSFYMNIKKAELNNASAELLKKIDSENLDQEIINVAEEYDISINLTDDTGKSIYNANITEFSHINIISDNQFDALYNKAKDNGGSILYEVSGKYRDLGGEEFPKPSSDGNTPPEFKNNNPSANSQDNNEDVNGAGNLFDKPSNSEMSNNRFNGKQAQDAKTMLYIKIIKSTAGDEYVLMMSSLITPVDATIYTLRIQFIYITIIFLILAITLSLIISHIVSKPIVKITTSAQKLAKGDMNVRFHGTGYREVMELSKTLNYAAEELGRTENLRQDLIANVSHDLRTPLTMITAYSEAMRDIPGENNPENVQVVIDEAKRLTNLVNDMLDLSKLQAGVMNLNLEKFDFTTKILAVMKRYSKLTLQQGYDIRFEYKENVCVIADEYKIYQVVYNLINNAINYAGDDKTVIVRQIVHGAIVRLEVEDHGVGIGEEELKNIWDRYYKVDKNHKRAIQGTGLGLSIVDNILKMHNAKYGVNSSAGKGSIFWFELSVVSE